MRNFKNKSVVILAIMMMSIFYSLFTKPKLAFVHGFSIFYLLMAYFLFNDNERKFSYFCALLFSIVALGNRHHYYLAFFIYILILFKQVFVNKNFKFCNFKLSKLNTYQVFLVIFILYMVLSLTWAFNKNMGISYIAKYIISISMMIMFIIENSSKTELKDTIKFFNYLFLGVLIIGSLEILGFDFGLPNHFDDMGIVHSYVKIIPVTFFYNPNNYAIFLVMGLITNCINLINDKKDRYYYLSFISFILIVINIIFTRSRTSLVATTLLFLFIAILSLINYKNKIFFKKTIKFSIKYFSMAFLIFFIISIFPNMSYYCGKFAKIPIVHEVQKLIFSKGTSSSLSESTSVIGATGSDNVRITIMYDILEGVLKEKHIFGFGVGNVGKWLMIKGNTHGIFAAHSFWFEIMGDFGIFILLYVIYIYANMFFKMLFKFMKTDFEDKNYCLVCLCLLFTWSMLVFGPSSVITFTPFWIFMGIIYSIFNQYVIKTKY